MILAVVLLVYFVLGALGCLLVCVNPNDPGMLGKLNRLFLGKIPAKIGNFIKRVFGERVFNWFGKAKHYIVETNHPLVQIFYIVIAPGGFIAYNLKGVMKFMPNEYVGEYQIAFIEILGLFCFWIYYKACSVSPGQITKQNQEYYWLQLRYFIQLQKKCQTCKTFKPPRSKHCRTCDACWSRFDHHCIWIRQCVGEKNYKYFLSFLFFHAILCLYYSVVGALSIYAYIKSQKLMQSQFWMGDKYEKANKVLVVSYLFMTHTMFIFLVIMCLIMGLTLLIFVLYHFYLVSLNSTSNQRVKSNDYVAELKQIIKHQNATLQEMGGWQNTPQEVVYFQKKYNRQKLQQLFKRNQDDLQQLSKGSKNQGFLKNMKIIFNY